MPIRNHQYFSINERDADEQVGNVIVMSNS